MKKLKLFASSTLIILAFSVPQTHLVQAMDKVDNNLTPIVKNLQLCLDKTIEESDKTKKELGEMKLLVEALIEKTEHLEKMLAIPFVARGHEEIYHRFLKGVLIYRPDGKTDNGRIDLPIASLPNPLDGTFDLSHCGDASQYISISSGYRKGKKAEDTSKIEIWLTPRFLVEKEIQNTARHFKGIIPKKWSDNAPIGIFWTCGGHEHLSDFDYITTQPMDELSVDNLFEKWCKSDSEQEKRMLHRVRYLPEKTLRQFSCSFFVLSATDK